MRVAFGPLFWRVRPVYLRFSENGIFQILSRYQTSRLGNASSSFGAACSDLGIVCISFVLLGSDWLLCSDLVLVGVAVICSSRSSSFLFSKVFYANSGLTFLIASSVRACLDSRLMTSFFLVIRSPTEIVIPAAMLQLIDKDRITAVSACGRT
jgi:hypothetical protein